jgi:hypothetical protein
MSTSKRSCLRIGASLGAFAGLVAVGTFANGGVAGAAPAPEDLAGAVRSQLAQVALSPVRIQVISSIAYPSQTGAAPGPQGVNVARTLDGQGAYVITNGPQGRIGFYAYRRDGGIRSTLVPPVIYDSWRQRGGEWVKGYPLEPPRDPVGSEVTRCPAGTSTVQTFARLNEPVSVRRLACKTPDKTVTWPR